MRRVRAFHIMPGVPGPEGELHAHDYRVEVVVERRELDHRGMVCDLDVLDTALAEIIAQVDGQNLERIRPEGTEAVTVEVFAGWVHARLAAALRGVGADFLAVRVWETADALANRGVISCGGLVALVDPHSTPQSARRTRYRRSDWRGAERGAAVTARQATPSPSPSLAWQPGWTSGSLSKRSRCRVTTPTSPPGLSGGQKVPIRSCRRRSTPSRN